MGTAIGQALPGAGASRRPIAGRREGASADQHERAAESPPQVPIAASAPRFARNHAPLADMGRGGSSDAPRAGRLPQERMACISSGLARADKSDRSGSAMT